MSASELALFGGNPVRKRLFPAHQTMGKEEQSAVQKVIESGNLSQFLGAWHQDFFGGPKVREFEAHWAEAFQAKHAISVNSNTSGLIAAMGAIGVGPGDEVIVSPYTMTASAIAPYIYGAVPVFADIDDEFFCITPESIARKITPRTKAILVVHIFGHPARMDEILALAKKHNIRVIEDCAQVPGAMYMGRPVGTLGDLGIFSLNYHKHIHTGEGGVIVTNDADLAERCQLIRNHGENVAEPKGVKDFYNLQGFNFRLPEIEAAIGIEQLKKLPALIHRRIENANRITSWMKQWPGITPPAVREGCTHVYYLHACRWNSQTTGLSRATLLKALLAELPSATLRETTPILGGGYVRPLYMQPVYQKRIGRCSFNCPRYEGEVDYSRGQCPVAERLHFEELFTHEYMRPSMTDEDLEDVRRGFEKVLNALPQLIEWERNQKSVKV
jgi:perosamine synthetase